MKDIFKFKKTMKIISLDKVGSDPEFFITDHEDKPIASFLFFEGTKDDPQDVGNGFKILKDNLLVEGNIPPANNRQEFIDNMEMLKSLISAVINPQKAKLIANDMMKYDDMWINTLDGQSFGCSVFIDSYTGKIIQTPILRNDNRTAGFHIHISYNKLQKKLPMKTNELNRLIGKAMDYFIGIPSDKIFSTPERRNNYGVFGAIRYTPYGLEYRSLGGFFTQKKYLGWVYDQTEKAIEYCSDLENLEKLTTITSASEDNYAFLGINIEQQVPELIKV